MDGWMQLKKDGRRRFEDGGMDGQASEDGRREGGMGRSAKRDGWKDGRMDG